MLFLDLLGLVGVIPEIRSQGQTFEFFEFFFLSR
jgi:hypothetical protein